MSHVHRFLLLRWATALGSYQREGSYLVVGCSIRRMVMCDVPVTAAISRNECPACAASTTDCTYWSRPVLRTSGRLQLGPVWGIGQSFVTVILHPELRQVECQMRLSVSLRKSLAGRPAAAARGWGRGAPLCRVPAYLGVPIVLRMRARAHRCRAWVHLGTQVQRLPCRVQAFIAPSTGRP